MRGQQDQMTNWYYGIVEDRNDPLRVGRVRVRVHGVHTDNKQFISTPDLPWSQVIMPSSSASLSGFGHSHGLVEGTSVFGMYRDDDMQDFIVFGSIMGISQKGYKETPSGEIVNRSVDAGFNDPRRATEVNMMVHLMVSTHQQAKDQTHYHSASQVHQL